MKREDGSARFQFGGNRIFAKRYMEENFLRIHEARLKGATWGNIADHMVEPVDYVSPGTLAKYYRVMCRGLGVRGVEYIKHGGVKGRRWIRK